MLELHWRRRLVEGIGAGWGIGERERERKEGGGGGGWASRVMLIGEERGRG